MAWTEHDVVRSELRWAAVTGGFVAIIFLLTLFAALALQRNPPSNLERIDSKTLHLTGGFTETNLGTRVEANGQVTTRIVATQFAFVPQCVVLPEGREVTLRLASADVIHGILVTGTTGAIERSAQGGKATSLHRSVAAAVADSGRPPDRNQTAGGSIQSRLL